MPPGFKTPSFLYCVQCTVVVSLLLLVAVAEVAVAVACCKKAFCCKKAKSKSSWKPILHIARTWYKMKIQHDVMHDATFSKTLIIFSQKRSRLLVKSDEHTSRFIDHFASFRPRVLPSFERRFR